MQGSAGKAIAISTEGGFYRKVICTEGETNNIFVIFCQYLALDNASNISLTVRTVHKNFT